MCVPKGDYEKMRMRWNKAFPGKEMDVRHLESEFVPFFIARSADWVDLHDKLKND